MGANRHGCVRRKWRAQKVYDWKAFQNRHENFRFHSLQFRIYSLMHFFTDTFKWVRDSNARQILSHSSNSFPNMFEVAPQLGPYEIFEIERIITKGSCFDFDLRRFIFPLGSFDHDWIIPYVSITVHIVFSSFTLSFQFFFDAFIVRSLLIRTCDMSFVDFIVFLVVTIIKMRT